MTMVTQGGEVPPIVRAVVQSGESRVADFIVLMKPRVMSLVVFTALVGMLVAPGHLDPYIGFITILCIASGAGASGALNMWYDADIDVLMTRTARRPIPRGRVSRPEAFTFGLALAAGSVFVLGLVVNIVAAALLAFTIYFYVVVYTILLKRYTPQNIVIGGAAGAFPPVIGWVANGSNFGIEPLILFLIIFLWTPPHFWALSLNRAGEYARASIPMLPIVAGRAETKRQILIYSLFLVAISVLPWVVGLAGAVYGVAAIVSGAAMVLLTLRLRLSGDADQQASRQLFAYSILYLFLLFAMLLIDAKVMGS